MKSNAIWERDITRYQYDEIFQVHKDTCIQVQNYKKKIQKHKIWEPDLTTYQDDEKCRNITQVHKYTCTKAHKK